MLRNSVLMWALRSRHEQKWEEIKDPVGLFKIKCH